jgi:hypothetical protein
VSFFVLPSDHFTDLDQRLQSVPGLAHIHVFAKQKRL